MALTASHDVLADDYLAVRRFTEALTGNVGPEDATVQSMPDASPVKWHLAHATWFFETFVLAREPGYRPLDPSYEALFNSYYNSVGQPFPRPLRGVLSRPTLDQVREYRTRVDHAILDQLEGGLADADPMAVEVLRLGLQHEQQHQELILTDIKHAFSLNPLEPALFTDRGAEAVPTPAPANTWTEFPEGRYEVGHAGGGFAYDNESPRHRVWLDGFRLSNAPVSCGEFAEFIADGGYRRSELWLSEGWGAVQAQGWQAPLYWRSEGGGWSEFTLAGRRPIEPARPVTHISYFEADAFARWAGARLPTEAEWEVAAASQPVAGNFADRLLADGMAPHPAPAPADSGPLSRLYGDCWEWTSSSYAPYPGYRPPPGALGEYNGKFMCNQYVLRGGSCASSQGHLRPTYRNFFAAAARWQFSGVRLARGAT